MDFDLMISSFPKLLDATLVTLKLVSSSLFLGIAPYQALKIASGGPDRDIFATLGLRNQLMWAKMGDASHIPMSRKV